MLYDCMHSCTYTSRIHRICHVHKILLTILSSDCKGLLKENRIIQLQLKVNKIIARINEVGVKNIFVRGWGISISCKTLNSIIEPLILLLQHKMQQLQQLETPSLQPDHQQPDHPEDSSTWDQSSQSLGEELLSSFSSLEELPPSPLLLISHYHYSTECGYEVLFLPCH